MGKGSFGVVRLGFHNEHEDEVDERVAIKIIYKNDILKKFEFQPQAYTKIQKQLQFEISLNDLDHPNVVKYLYCEDSSDRLQIVMEYCDKSFQDYLQEKRDVLKQFKKRKQSNQLISLSKLNPLLPEDEISYWVSQIASGIQYFYKRQIMHRDLKPQNLLLKLNPNAMSSTLSEQAPFTYKSTSKITRHFLQKHESVKNTSLSYKDYTLKISDFGLCKSYDYLDQPHATLAGTRAYIAPEAFTKQGYTNTIDLWSIGIIMLEMITGINPFRTAVNVIASINNFDLQNQINSYQLSQNCKNLLSLLLTKDPKNRITFEEFFVHPFLQQGQLSLKNQTPPTPIVVSLQKILNPHHSQRQEVENLEEEEEEEDGFVMINEFRNYCSSMKQTLSKRTNQSIDILEEGTYSLFVHNCDSFTHEWFPRHFNCKVTVSNQEKRLFHKSSTPVHQMVSYNFQVRKLDLPCKLEVVLTPVESNVFVQYLQTSSVPYLIQVIKEEERL